MNLLARRLFSIWLVAFTAAASVHAASVAPVAAEHGMVMTAQHLATKVGVDVLKRGGKAVDAAVAVGYALAVVYPAAGNLGGGGFMTLHLADGRQTFISAQAVHYQIEAMRHAYVDRNFELGDPAFVDNPVAHLLDRDYAAQIRARIQPQKAGVSAELKPGMVRHEGSNTTHYSIADAAGNAVSVTYTLNDWFGAKVTAGGTGILLNNEMDNFTSKVGAPNLYGLIQGEANAIAPGRTAAGQPSGRDSDRGALAAGRSGARQAFLRGERSAPGIRIGVGVLRSDRRRELAAFLGNR